MAGVANLLCLYLFFTRPPPHPKTSPNKQNRKKYSGVQAEDPNPGPIRRLWVLCMEKVFHLLICAYLSFIPESILWIYGFLMGENHCAQSRENAEMEKDKAPPLRYVKSVEGLGCK